MDPIIETGADVPGKHKANFTIFKMCGKETLLPEKAINISFHLSQALGFSSLDSDSDLGLTFLIMLTSGKRSKIFIYINEIRCYTANC